MALKTLTFDKVTIGHNRAEIYLKFDSESSSNPDASIVIVLTPFTAKELTENMGIAMQNWSVDNPHEFQKLSGKKLKVKAESVPKRVIKSLYKSRKLTDKIISINTKRRKHIPD